jgi:rhodanese-related sulfurtransferase
MKSISAEELKEQLDNKMNITLIDVREPYEHEEFNIGGILIPLADIPSSGDKLRELGETEIVFYCRSGNRSAMAQKLLAIRFGIESTNLNGGLIAWRQAT